jgi:hypothetical protein
MRGGDAPDRRYAASIRHLEVHQDELGLQILNESFGFAPCLRLTHPRHFRKRLQERYEALPEKRVIVRD